MDTITIISLLIGLLGLIATLVGTYLTYISFINPIIRFNCFLKKPQNWEKFGGVDPNIYIYRYKKYPNFQIVIDWDKEIVDNFQEEWMSFYPDNQNNASYYVKLEVNGMLLDKESFVSLDGHRYFVPVPRTKKVNNEIKYFYDIKQVYLSNIIGKYHFEENSIYDFAKNQKNLSVETEPTKIEKIKNYFKKIYKICITFLNSKI